jgi:hypothetical protein
VRSGSHRAPAMVENVDMQPWGPREAGECALVKA